MEGRVSGGGDAVAEPGAAVGRRGTAWWTRLGRPSPVATDVVVAAALALAVTLAAITASEPSPHRSVLASCLLGLGLGGLALVRHRWPVVVLVLSAVWLTGYHALDYPAIGSTWPLVVALYTCGVRGRLWPAIAVTAATLTTAAWARLILEPEPVLQVLASGIQEIAIPGLVIALGDAVRSRRGWAAEAHERVRRIERDRERDMTRRIVEERVRIARELHDITAHTLAVAGIQLSVAADALNDSPDEAKAALRTAQQANREATTELKAAVGVLRREDDALPRSPTPGLDGVRRLVENARESGLQVAYDESGEIRPLPAPVGLAVYRVVQESLTNVLRHANAVKARVQIDYQPVAVSVRIADDGHGMPPPRDADGADGRTGYGIIGMRERTLGLGGEFAAGPGEDGGYVVRASIPVEAAP